jgi:hypothetical protein
MFWLEMEEPTSRQEIQVNLTATGYCNCLALPATLLVRLRLPCHSSLLVRRHHKNHDWKVRENSYVTGKYCSKRTVAITLGLAVSSVFTQHAVIFRSCLTVTVVHCAQRPALPDPACRPSLQRYPSFRRVLSQVSRPFSKGVRLHVTILSL